MNVGDLREAIRGLPDDMPVILQKDAEGNGYSPLRYFGMGYYIPENAWSGDIYDENWSADECDMSDQEWLETRTSNPRVIILAPVN